MSLFTRLNYFNSVVEHGSISQASRIYDVQPSSISRQLVTLENELGVRLLDRTTRNIGLTESGRRFYDYSKRIVAEFDEAKRAVGDLHQVPRGTLKISSTIAFGESQILPLLPAFRRRYPDIDVEVELTERVVDLIEEHVDIAIRSGQLADSNLVAKKLMNNDFLLCASPGYLRRHGTPSAVDELSRHDCVVYGYRGWNHWFELDGEARKLAISRYMMVDSVNGQKQLILSGGGLALLPQWSVNRELQRGELVRLLDGHNLSPSEQPTATYAVYQHRQLVPGKVRAFLDFLTERLGS